MATQTFGNVGGDLLQHEDNAGISRDSKTVANATGAEITLEAGYPMDDNVPVVSGGEAATDGLLIEQVVIPDGESRKVAVLARGPTAVNQDAIPATDYADADLTLATIVTAVEALGIVVREEPENQEVQET